MPLIDTLRAAKLGADLSPLDPNFTPLPLARQIYEAVLRDPCEIFYAIVQPGGAVFRGRTLVSESTDPEDVLGSLYFLKEALHNSLWVYGGTEIFVCVPQALRRGLSEAVLSPRWIFNSGIMKLAYGEPLQFRFCAENELPEENQQFREVGGHRGGFRVGLDWGGSDWKLGVIDPNGEVLYTLEFPWTPKSATDPRYHEHMLLAAMHLAAAHCTPIDAVGVSSAGIWVGNKVRIASLFSAVDPTEENQRRVQNLFTETIFEPFGRLPVVVVNDGDVAAMAFALELKATGVSTPRVLGTALGTSYACGYYTTDREGNGGLTPRLNEAAFMVLDLQPKAAPDNFDNSPLRGVLSVYGPQDAVIRLAGQAGIPLDPQHTTAQKLAYIQKLAENGDERAVKVFQNVGAYQGHATAELAGIYSIDYLPVFGRVVSGAGGQVLLNETRKVAARYPQCAGIKICTIADEVPEGETEAERDKRERQVRVGQAIAAASLPKI